MVCCRPSTWAKALTCASRGFTAGTLSCANTCTFETSACTTCGNNTTAFFLDLWHNLPRHVRLRAVRADSGFCLPELLALWEQLRVPYMVAAQLSEPIKTLLRGDQALVAQQL